MRVPVRELVEARQHSVLQVTCLVLGLPLFSRHRHLLSLWSSLRIICKGGVRSEVAAPVGSPAASHSGGR